MQKKNIFKGGGPRMIQCKKLTFFLSTLNLTPFPPQAHHGEAASACHISLSLEQLLIIPLAFHSLKAQQKDCAFCILFGR